MTYKQAYDKIIDAYFKDEIQPLDAHFCFCGTLCDKTNHWFLSCRGRHNDSHGYKGDDFVRMEMALLNTLDSEIGAYNTNHQDYEHFLFLGMSAALDELKKIHIERGEVIDEVPEFTKRQLA